MEIRFYLQLFLRRLPVFIVVALLCSAVGVTLARILPPVYVSKALMVVESEQIPGDLAASTVETAATEQMQIIQQRILSRDTLLDMANRLEIFADERAEGRPLNADQIVGNLRSRIEITTSGPAANNRGPQVATLVEVVFRAPTGEIAAAVTNDVVTLILKEDVAMRTGSARETLDFFEQEVQRLDQELASKSADILAFKQENAAALPDNLDFNRSSLLTLQERAIELDRTIAAVQEQLTRLKNRQAATGSSEAVVEAPQTSEQRQLQELRDQRLALAAVLSAENPRVRLLDAQIEALDKIVAQQIAGANVDAAGEPVSAFDAQLAELNFQIENLGVERVAIGEKIAELQDIIVKTPSNAIALEVLQRDYSAIRQQYDRAVENRATAETGDTIEALSKGQRITVIDQATVPTSPESPNRPLIAVAGVGGGMALGVALVLLIELTKPGIRRPVDLQNKLGITAFATLPYVRTRGQSRRRSVIILLAILVLVVGIPLGLWMVNEYVYPFLDLFSRLMASSGTQYLLVKEV